MILITQFWNFENSKRKEEIYKCLYQNLNNRYISKIYILIEGNKKISLNHNKIRQISVNKRYSYYEMFKLVSDNFRKQKCIIANADIHFDSSLSKLLSYSLTNKVLALSNQGKSIDAWALDSTINAPKSNIKFGESYNDLRYLKLLMQNNIRVINPSKDINYTEIDSFKFLSKEVLTEDLSYILPGSLSSNDPVVNKSLNIIKTENIVVKKDKAKVYVKTNPKINKIDIKKVKINSKIGVILHLYYQDLWSEYETLLSNIDTSYDLYVTLTEGSSTLGQTLWIKKKLESFGAKVFILPNKGLDIGPFLYVLNHIFNSNIEYDYILKLHTKKSIKTAGYEFGRNWRMNLLMPLLGSNDIFHKNIRRLEDDRIGMIGSSSWVSQNKNGNEDWINYYRNKLNIRGGNTFIGGTMFWVKWDIIKRHFNRFNVMNIYNELEKGYFHDHNGSTKTHSLERILGYMVESDNKKVIGV